MPKNAKKQVVSSQYIDPSHFFGDHSISTYNAIVTSVTLSYTLTKYVHTRCGRMRVRTCVRTYVRLLYTQ